MAPVTLIDLHVVAAPTAPEGPSADDFLGHRGKVLHVVARRRLVALRAVLGRRRGVQERGDGPGSRLMAPGAFAPEELLVGVLVAVAAGTAQGILLGRPGDRDPQETGKVVEHLPRHARMP